MKKITIGRNADNDIVIADQSVSGYHAEIEIHEDGIMKFVDHSTNGTMVNGNHLHNDFCNVSGIDDIVFPGQHKLDWTLVPVPAEQPAPAPVQPQYQQPAQPALAPVQPQYQQPAQPAPAPVQPQYQQPVQPAPAPVQPQYQQPVQPAPAPVQPQYQQPAQPAPAPVQPQYQQPVQPAPAPVQPQYQQPMAPQAAPGYQYGQQQYQPVCEASMGFVEVLTRFWKNYFNFSGRARRKEYWLMVVWNMIFGIVPFLGWLVILAGSIGYLSLLIRRLHDSGKSGWLALLGLIPLVGSIIIFVFCCQDSDRCDNKWGKSPKFVAC